MKEFYLQTTQKTFIARSFEKQGEALIKADQKSVHVNQKHMEVSRAGQSNAGRSKDREELRAGHSKHREEIRAGQSKHREELRACQSKHREELRAGQAKHMQRMLLRQSLKKTREAF